MRKNRFTIIKTDRLNPETLQNDVDIWAVKDTATGHWISEHDTAKGAKQLCSLLNVGTIIEKDAEKHRNTDFTTNDAEIDSANSIVECAFRLVSHYFPTTTEKQP